MPRSIRFDRCVSYVYFIKTKRRREEVNCTATCISQWKWIICKSCFGSLSLTHSLIMFSVCVYERQLGISALLASQVRILKLTWLIRKPRYRCAHRWCLMPASLLLLFAEQMRTMYSKYTAFRERKRKTICESVKCARILKSNHLHRDAVSADSFPYVSMLLSEFVVVQFRFVRRLHCLQHIAISFWPQRMAERERKRERDLVVYLVHSVCCNCHGFYAGSSFVDWFRELEYRVLPAKTQTARDRESEREITS